MGTPHSDIREKKEINLANPGAATNCFSANLTVHGKSPILRITVVPATTSVVQVQEVDLGSTIAYDLNNGSTVTADAVAAFDMPCASGATYNVQFVTNQTGNSAVIKKVHMVQLES